MAEHENHREIRSEEVQEIISYIPPWIIRWGITALALFVVCIVSIGFLVKYPDVIPAPIMVTTYPEPMRIAAQKNGNLILNISDGSHVEVNELLGYVQSAAEPKDIIALSKALGGISTSPELKDLEQYRDAMQNGKYGSLQDPINNWNQAVISLLELRLEDYYGKRINTMYGQLESMRRLAHKLAERGTVLARELELAQRKLKTDKGLAQKGVISQSMLDESEALMLSKQREVKGAEIEAVEQQLKSGELEKEIQELELEQTKEQNRRLQDYETALNSLRASVKAWLEKNTFISDRTGTVSFAGFRNTGEFVQEGQLLMNILPESRELIGKVEMGSFGAGKVVVDQAVRIRLDDYPAEQFGLIEGRIESISPASTQGLYQLRIALPNPLVSTYGKSLPFKASMQGQTEIITEDLRLIERVFYQFRKLWQ